jgi:hypothetical protein
MTFIGQRSSSNKCIASRIRATHSIATFQFVVPAARCSGVLPEGSRISSPNAFSVRSRGSRDAGWIATAPSPSPLQVHGRFTLGDYDAIDLNRKRQSTVPWMTTRPNYISLVPTGVRK